MCAWTSSQHAPLACSKRIHVWLILPNFSLKKIHTVCNVKCRYMYIVHSISLLCIRLYWVLYSQREIWFIHWKKNLRRMYNCWPLQILSCTSWLFIVFYCLICDNLSDAGDRIVHFFFNFILVNIVIEPHKGSWHTYSTLHCTYSNGLCIFSKFCRICLSSNLG